MRRTLARSTVAIVLALLGAVPVAAAQSGDEAAVAQAVEAFRTAMLTADRAQCEALTAAPLSAGHSAGRVETTAQWIDAATSRRSTWTCITLTGQTMQSVGQTAIVRHTLTGETEHDGQSNPVKRGVLLVWHQQNGDGQLLARQAVRLEAPRTNGVRAPLIPCPPVEPRERR
jgi:ketosteroid isomerase-like protein